MEDLKNKVEAVLFTTGRFIDLEELSKFCEVGSVGIIKKALEDLKEDYSKRTCALELIEDNNRWKLNIKRDYLYLTEKLLTDSELDKPTQETLAVIAYKNPIFQCDIIKIRGNTAYDHVKALEEHGLVTSEKSGRTKLLKLAPKFYDYFDITEDKLKGKLETPKNGE